MKLTYNSSCPSGFDLRVTLTNGNLVTYMRDRAKEQEISLYVAEGGALVVVCREPMARPGAYDRRVLEREIGAFGPGQWQQYQEVPTGSAPTTEKKLRRVVGAADAPP